MSYTYPSTGTGIRSGYTRVKNGITRVTTFLSNTEGTTKITLNRVTSTVPPNINTSYWYHYNEQGTKISFSYTSGLSPTGNFAYLGQSTYSDEIYDADGNLTSYTTTSLSGTTSYSSQVFNSAGELIENKTYIDEARTSLTGC